MKKILIIGSLLLMLNGCKNESNNFTPQLPAVGDLVLAEVHISKYYMVGGSTGLFQRDIQKQVWKSAPYTYSASVDFGQITVNPETDSEDKMTITLTLPPVKIAGKYNRWGEKTCIYEEKKGLHRFPDRNEEKLAEDACVDSIKMMFQGNSILKEELVKEAQNSAGLYLRNFMENLYGKDIIVNVNFKDEEAK